MDLSLAAMVIGVLGCKGESRERIAATLPRTANAAVTILDESTDRWFSRANLYLKVESTLEPGVAILLPINVKRFDGEARIVHRTPFTLRPNAGETLLLEWLDDQSLTSTEREKLVAAWETGGWVVAIGGQILLVKRADPLFVTTMGKLAREAGELLINEPGARNFKSFGKADYHVPVSPPATFRDANSLVLVHARAAKAEVRFFYPDHAAK